MRYREARNANRWVQKAQTEARSQSERVREGKANGRNDLVGSKFSMCVYDMW